MCPTPPRGREILRCPFASLRAAAQDDRGFAQDDRRSASSAEGAYAVGIASLAVLGYFASRLRDRWDIGDRRSIVSEVDQTRMVGGGVETTGGRDQLPGHLHAQEHFAPGFVVIGGGLEDVGDALGGGAVV
jgi:hypothetical protein